VFLREVTRYDQLTEQRQELRLFACREVGRVSERAHFVLLSDQGKSPPEIAGLFGYSTASICEWLKRYQAEGSPDSMTGHGVADPAR
jgi:hypothetical protein